MAVNLTSIPSTSGAADKSWLQQDIRLTPWRYKAKRKHVLYNTLATLLESGLDAKSALDLFSAEVRHKHESEIIDQLAQHLLAGSDLAGALATSSQFSDYEVQSVRIGESSGRLITVLEGLSEHFESRVAFQQTVTRVMAYPVFVLSVSAGVIWFMLAFVVPMFAGVFDRFDAELPGLTQTVVRLSAWTAANAWWLAALVAAVGIGAWTVRKKVWFRSGGQWVLARLPLFGKLYYQITEARFCRSMHLLLSSGNSLSASLEMSENMLTSLRHREILAHAREAVARGASLSAALEKHPEISSRLRSLIRVGEQTGKLPLMFEKLALQTTQEVQHRSKVVSTLLEPLLIVVLAVVVGFILIAMYLPLFELGNVIG